MVKIYKYTELGKLQGNGILSFILIYFAGPFLLYKSNNTISILSLFILLSWTSYIIFKTKRNNNTGNLPNTYFIMLYLLFLSIIITIILILINNAILFSYGLIFVLFVYLIIFGQLLYYLSNLIYIFGLKRKFPKEMKINQDYVLSIKKMSKFIILEKQKIYYNLTLINGSIYLILVWFGMLLIMKQLNGKYFEDINLFSYWIRQQDYLTLFNLISLLSLMIGIYSVTIPVQLKIINEGRLNYRERFKDYL